MYIVPTCGSNQSLVFRV